MSTLLRLTRIRKLPYIQFPLSTSVFSFFTSRKRVKNMNLVPCCSIFFLFNWQSLLMCRSWFGSACFATENRGNGSHCEKFIEVHIPVPYEKKKKTQQNKTCFPCSPVFQQWQLFRRCSLWCCVTGWKIVHLRKKENSCSSFHLQQAYWERVEK